MKWDYYDDNGPDACGAVGCKDDWNGLYYTSIKVGGTRFWINACEKCMKKANKKRKKKKKRD